MQSVLLGGRTAGCWEPKAGANNREVVQNIPSQMGWVITRVVSGCPVARRAA